MKKFLFTFIISLSAVLTAHGQSILADWEGAYEGEMIMGNTSRPNDSVKVIFEFTPLEIDSTWTYKMTYLSDKYGTIIKDYQLTRVGDSKVDFLLDEKDGIVIEMSFMNDCFYSVFEVMGNLYSTSLRKSGDELHFDLFSSNMKGGTLTKNEAEDPEDVFEVTSYKPALHQSVLFKRQKETGPEEAKRKALEAYQKLVAAADEAYKNKNFERALELYERASTLNPGDTYVKKQASKTAKRVNE